MTAISLPNATTLMYSTSDPLQMLQVNPNYQHFTFKDQNYSSVFQQLLCKLYKQKSPHKEKFTPEPPPSSISTESTIIHLVRPKSTQHIDLDSIIKPKKSQSKKKKSQKSSNPKTFSHSISSFDLSYSPSSFFEPPRNILTPNWIPNEPEAALQIKGKDNDIFKSFNIIPVHSRIEVFEYRIQMGEDENHLHPALARIAAESTENDSFTKIEKEKATRYEEQKVIQKIPLFWPPRVYDTEEDKMSEQESDHLEKIIQNEIESVGKDKKKKKIAKSRSIPISSLLPSQNKKKSSFSNSNTKKVGRPPKFSTITSFYFDNYITDDEDLTDFDF